ncbi:MAG: sulfatase-like hydrolase/transferase, partial [Thermogutta sp.]|uniref:sulfatase-like hydrolase/transferase n=1 Tax=Thermogutta sp. TaxID=1962930 RepID=UPI0019BBAA99
MPRWIVFILAGLISVSTLARAGEEQLVRPNIILVFIDDMGWGDFSCFGNTEAKTPNVDALAAGGIRFYQ